MEVLVQVATLDYNKNLLTKIDLRLPLNLFKIKTKVGYE